MAGKDGWMRPNVEMQLDLERARAWRHGVAEGDGRWWWALNGCTNQPEGWPLGPVVGQTALGAGMAGTDGWVQMQHDLAGDGGGRVRVSETLPGVAGEWWWASNECASLPKEGPLGPVLKRSHSRMWVTRWATASKCGNVTGFGTCMAVPGCGKIDKMLMERVYGGHINGAPSMGKMAVRPVCVCGAFMNWPGVHVADWVKPKTVLHKDIPTVHKTPLGTGMGCACLRRQHGAWLLVVAGASWGCAKSVVNLAISPHASANPTIPQQIVCLHEGLSLQVTQGGAERMDELTQKGNSAGGCDMVARAWRAEERPWGGARESRSTGNSQRSDWKREMLVWKKMKKAGD